MEDLNEEYRLSSFENFYDKFLGNSMKQANEKNQGWRDDRDVDKAFEEWFVDPKQTAFYRISPTGEHWFAIQSVKNFAMYYAQRCGVDVDGECEHPYHSVVGGGGKPERCLKCGRVLSD